MKRTTPILILAAALLLTACQTKNASPVNMKAGPNEPALQFNVPGSVATPQILQAVENSLIRREWNNVSVSDNEITASLVHRKMDASLRIAVNGSTVSIYSDSWRLNSDGERRKREHPEGWIRNLQKDVTAALVSGS